MKNTAASAMQVRMATKPLEKPISAWPIRAPTAPIMIAARSAFARSARRVASGTQTMRTTIGAASTMPIAAASSPLCSSHSGKNGMPNPVATPKVA